MPSLAELKRHGARLFAAGDYARSLFWYGTVLRRFPGDIHARVRIADCLAPDPKTQAQAVEIYRNTALYAASAGHPLVSIVVARILASLGIDASDVISNVVFRYGKESELHLAMGARLGLPGNEIICDLSDEEKLEQHDLAGLLHLAIAGPHQPEFPSALLPIPLLSELTENALRRVIATVNVHRLGEGATVFHQGAAGQSFYMVAAGEVRIVRQPDQGQKIEMARLRNNAVFGEMALLSRAPRMAGVEVTEEADLLELTVASLSALADELPAVGAILSKFAQERVLENTVSRSALFREFSPSEQAELVRRFSLHEAAADSVVIHQGEVAPGLFLVVTGQLDVLRSHDGERSNVIGRLGPSDVFGEMSIISGQLTSATVVAKTSCSLLFLAREVVERLCAGRPQVEAYLRTLAEDRALESALIQTWV